MGAWQIAITVLALMGLGVAVGIELHNQRRQGRRA